MMFTKANFLTYFISFKNKTFSLVTANVAKKILNVVQHLNSLPREHHL